MKRELAICLVLAVGAVAPVPASAQYLLPPYEITTSVRSMGLKPVSPPMLRGKRYVLRAVDRRGVEVNVAVNAVSGRVMFIEEAGNGPIRDTRAYPGGAPPSAGNQASGDPTEPSVIYAEPRETNPPRPPARVPGAAKPPVPKVAARPPAKPAAPAEAEKPTEASSASVAPEKSPDTTGSTTAAAQPASPAEKNPALVAPPVQAFD